MNQCREEPGRVISSHHVTVSADLADSVSHDVWFPLRLSSQTVMSIHSQAHVFMSCVYTQLRIAPEPVQKDQLSR